MLWCQVVATCLRSFNKMPTISLTLSQWKEKESAVHCYSWWRTMWESRKFQKEQHKADQSQSLCLGPCERMSSSKRRTIECIYIRLTGVLCEDSANYHGRAVCGVWVHQGRLELSQTCLYATQLCPRIWDLISEIGQDLEHLEFYICINYNALHSKDRFFMQQM